MKALMICRSKVLLLLLFLGLTAKAQMITEIASSYDDNIKEWIVYTDDEDLEGLISLKWPLEDNFKEWVYSLGDHAGSLAVKWDNNSDLWELKPDGGDVVMIRSAWSGDFSEWIFSSGKKKYRLQSRFGKNGLEWVIKEKNRLVFSTYMSEEGDPLIWLVDDLLVDESLDLMIGFSFIAILHSLQ